MASDFRWWHSVHLQIHFSNRNLLTPYLAPTGEGPLHTQLLVTGLGVHRAFGMLDAQVIGHRGGEPRGLQLLAGHPAGLDATTTAPGTGGPGSHHPPAGWYKCQGDPGGVLGKGALDFPVTTEMLRWGNEQLPQKVCQSPSLCCFI